SLRWICPALHPPLTLLLSLSLSLSLPRCLSMSLPLGLCLFTLSVWVFLSLCVGRSQHAALCQWLGGNADSQPTSMSVYVKTCMEIPRENMRQQHHLQRVCTASVHTHTHTHTHTDTRYRER